MTQTTTLAQARISPSSAMVNVGFFDLQGFELMQRVSKMLSSSTLVPTAYRSHKEIKSYGQVTGYEENPAALPNCIVALNMAQRMGADPLMIMQNLHIIEGRPSWSSAYIIASINSCGRYSSLRFDISEPGEPTVVEYVATEWKAPAGGGKKVPVEVKKKVTVRHQTCKAWAIEKETGERLESPTVSIQMAIDEGWLTKNGSKWQTIPELMLRYRCASFFGRLYAPELLMGLQASEEVQDTIEARTAPDGTIYVNTDELRRDAEKPEAAKPESKPRTRKATAPEATDTTFKPASNVDEATGEVLSDPPAYMDTEKVRNALASAKDHDVLDVAADLINEVHPDDSAGLSALYRQRRDELDGVAHVPQETTTPTRNRRAAAADME
ncbi:MAG: hypothetical protein KA735_04685 [Burkholderiaceae bacterium]|nr:hypothetical protein [Burkholderiaceae bacterium]